MKKRLSLIGILSSLILSLVAGCGPELPPTMPKLYKMKLRVHYSDDMPVANAQIKLLRHEPMPLDWFIIGTTDKNGMLPLEIYGRFKGIPLGDYTVTINKKSESPSEFGDVPPADSSEYESWGRKRATEEREIYNYVNDVYSDPETSDLVLHIEKGKSYYEIDIGDNPNEFIGYTELSGESVEDIEAEAAEAENEDGVESEEMEE